MPGSWAPRAVSELSWVEALLLGVAGLDLEPWGQAGLYRGGLLWREWQLGMGVNLLPGLCVSADGWSWGGWVGSSWGAPAQLSVPSGEGQS